MTSEEIIEKLLPILPDEGKMSKRAFALFRFALFSAERVKHLNPDPRVAARLEEVRQKARRKAQVDWLIKAVGKHLEVNP